MMNHKDTMGTLGDGRPASIDESFSNIGTLFKRSMGSLGMAWVAIFVVSIIMGLPKMFLDLVVRDIIPVDLPDISPMAMLALTITFTLASMIGTFALAGISMGLYRPMRTAMVEGKASIGGLSDVIRSASTRLLPTLGVLFLMTVAIFVGTLMCIIPGIIAAFLLCMAPYLVATRDELGVMDSLKQSVRLAQENFVAILVPIILIIVVVLPIQFVIVALMAGSMLALGPVTMVAFVPVSWLVGFVLNYAIWIVFGATYITIETADAGVETV